MFRKLPFRLAGGCTAAFVFCSISAAQSGPPQFGGQVFPTGTSPRAACIADVNNDGVGDAATANFITHDATVLLSTGAGGLGGILTFTTGTNPVDIGAGDFDANGNIDLAVLNFGAGTITVSHGPFFVTFSGGPVGVSPQALAVADLNNDGSLDLVACNTGSHDVSVLIQFPGGAFVPTTYPALTPAPGSIATGDFNQDGTTDVITVHSGAGTTELWSNDGAGNLTVIATNTTAGTPVSAATAEFNGDGLIDTAFARASATSVRIHFGQAAFGFTTKDVDAGGAQDFILASDIYPDGRTDLAILQKSQDRIAYFQNGPGTTFLKKNLAAVAAVERFAAGNMDLDGAMDVVIPIAGVAPQFRSSVVVVRGAGAEPLVAGGPIATGNAPEALLISDMNIDGDPDIVTSNSGDNTVVVHFGGGDGFFPFRHVVPAVGSAPYAAAAADWNGDGYPDLQFINYNSGDLEFHTSTNAPSYVFSGSQTAGTAPVDAIAGDFNHDGLMDIAVANSGSSNISIHFSGGGVPPPAAQYYNAGSTPSAVVASDLNGDGMMDIAVANTGSATVSLLYQSSGAFTRAPSLTTGFAPVGLVVGALTSPGARDIAVASIGSSDVNIFKNGPPGSFQLQFAISTAAGPVALTTNDVNQDLVMDLVVACSSINNLQILEGSGGGQFVNTTTATSPIQVSTLASGDFNHDGAPDVAAASNQGHSFVILRKVVQGSQVGPLAYQVPFQRVHSIPAADLNGDGFVDLLAAGGAGVAGGSASICINEGGVLKTPFTTFLTSPAPLHTMLADMNADGNPEAVVPASSSGFVQIHQGTGAGGFSAQVTLPAGTNVADIDVNDINLDGLPDLVASNVGNSDVRIFINQGSLQFSTPQIVPVPFSTVSINLRDFNADGFTDVSLANQLYQGVALLYGSAGLGFLLTSTVTTGAVVQLSSAVDILGDGTPEIVIANPSSGTVAVLGGFVYGFAPQILQSVNVGGPVFFVDCTDIDGDGRTDLISSNGISSQVAICYGNGPGVGGGLGTFGTPALYHTFGTAGRITAADFDADGRMDLVVSNTAGPTFTMLRNLHKPAAGLVRFSQGSPGCRGMIAAAASPGPKVNTSNFVITATGAPPGMPGVGIITDAATINGFDALGIGALLNLDFAASAFAAGFIIFTDFSGAATSEPLVIPQDPGLAGNTYFSQLLFIENAREGLECNKYSPIGFASSRALAITIAP